MHSKKAPASAGAFFLRQSARYTWLYETAAVHDPRLAAQHGANCSWNDRSDLDLPTPAVIRLVACRNVVCRRRIDWSRTIAAVPKNATRCFGRSRGIRGHCFLYFRRALKSWNIISALDLTTPGGLHPTTTNMALAVRVSSFTDLIAVSLSLASYWISRLPSSAARSQKGRRPRTLIRTRTVPVDGCTPMAVVPAHGSQCDRPLSDA